MRATIRDKAVVGVDMHMVVWRDDGTIFEVEPLTASRSRLVAPGFGASPYDNGALYVLEDIINMPRGLHSERGAA